QSRLKDSRVGVVIKQLLPHIERPEIKDEEAPVSRCHRYLSNHREQMSYQEALAAGLPIGSGEVEGGHRWVVQERLKKAGAWWQRENAKKCWPYGSIGRITNGNPTGNSSVKRFPDLWSHF
ncbi:MAG TPA: hypothetical protein VNO70_26055, partial [Blastocatellia bacterium]|nr:hypothetical protein [Blastocatellia bacterium]